MTEEQFLEAYQRFFDDHMLSMTRDGDKVILVSDGRFGVHVGEGWEKSFSVGFGETFHRAPDRHEHCTFKVLEIMNTGIKISYESTFDHRSFGKDEVRVDSGIIILKYRSR